MAETDLAAIVDGLRQAMRGIVATVIALATRDAGGERHAIVATSVTSLSFAPPSLLACINTASSIAPHLDVGTRFSANVLRVEHADVSRILSDSTRRSDRFADDAWAEGDGGIPYFAAAQSTIFCRVTQLHAYGTHQIAIGDVYQVINSAAAAAPLLYAGGKYTALSSKEFS